MEKPMRLFIIIFLLSFTTFFFYNKIQATSEIIGISNLTRDEQKAGIFEINGIVLNNGTVSKVAIKVGNIAPWEAVEGIENWQYQLNSRQIVIGYENKYDSGLGKLVKTYKRGSYYGPLNITLGAFDERGDILAEKTVAINIIPEKPYSNITSGEYSESLNVELKATPDVNIYYTTNGTDPSIYGYYFSGVIYVNQDTVIKAVARNRYGSECSEVYNLNIKINAAAQATFKIQYYADEALTLLLPDPPYLKAGTYYLKIITNKKYSTGPSLSINTAGSVNDVSQANLTSINDYVYRYSRIITNDAAADGEVQEIIRFNGLDNHGNSVQNVTPVNFDMKAAYPDTQPPAQGSIALTGGGLYTNDPTPKLSISSTGADQMRLALSESGLATATWVSYAAQYDEFDISSDGNGNKTIWIEYKDRAGNIQTQHSYTAVTYDNSIFSFGMEYFADAGLSRSLGNTPYLKAGTYFLKITVNQDLNYSPTVQINAEGSNNDVTTGLTTKINSKIFCFTRTIVTDSAAVGLNKEQITIQGIAPSNIDTKGAYTDTQPPGIPAVSGIASTEIRKPTWTWNNVIGADKFRYSFTNGSNWVETKTTSFTPENDLSVASYTLYVQAGDLAGNWSESGSFSTMIVNVPHINVKQGVTGIPNGTGNYVFGSIAVGSTTSVSFTIENTGAGNLNLTGSPKVQISGMDASQYSVTVQPSSPVSPNGNATFTVRFSPTSSGSKTAKISIASNDLVKNPYEFTVTGTGDIIALTLDNWTPGNIASGNVKMYSFNAVIGKSYAISWDDSYEGSGTYTCNINVSGYHQDLTTTYFSNINSGYINPRIITAQDNIVYISVAGYNSTLTGTYALKVTEIIPESVINVKQGSTIIANGMGSYNYGNVSRNSTSNISFTIENSGTSNLNLTGSPKVQISGADASQFSVTINPTSPVIPYGSTTFRIGFTPASTGVKTATVSITNDDADKTPYTFTITGTGTAMEALALDTWNQGSITSYSVKTYSLNVTSGKTYAVCWDDSGEGSGTYTCDIKVSGYHQDLTTTYFGNINSGYINPRFITAQDNIVYISVAGYNSTSTGTYALKVTETITESVINVKQGSTIIANGTGSYNYGNVSSNSTSNINFTIENSGTTNLNLTGNPKVQISGAEASQFRVTLNPTSPVIPYGSTTFRIGFTPASTGVKTATVSITSDDADKTPYTFTVTGTGTAMEVLTPDIWNQGSLTNYSSKTYSLNVTIGKTYAVRWDDSAEGSGTYTCNVNVSGYHQDLTTTYFSNIASGYINPGIITAQDNIVYISVAGNSPSGTYAVKVTEIIPEPPVINVKQGSTIIANGTGSYNYGNVSSNSTSNINFTIENSGTTNLNLTGNPKVQISGADASQFSVINNPSSPVIPYGSSTLGIGFTPKSTGVKTATVSIASNDADKTPYTFTVTGTGTAMEVLALDTWKQGSLTSYSVKTYSLNVISGKTYAVHWDDSVEGSGIYTCDIKVSGYHQDLTTTYFSNFNSGYINPGIITALDNIVYISVTGYYSGTYALKVTEIIPEPPVINVKQGSTIIANGTGSYNYGNVSRNSTSNIPFTIENNGTTNLNLTGNPKVQISGADASQFSVTINPTSPVVPYGGTTFRIGFTPTSTGVKTATVSITNDDADNTPYTFTITGTGTAMEALAPDTWNQGSLTSYSTKTYSLNVTSGKTYAVRWDDSYEGSGTYTCDIKVSGYHQDLTTTYFSNINSGYINPRFITAQDNIVYISVAGYSPTSTGTYALKVTEIIPEPPVINIKQGSTIIANGTGSYNYGNVSSNSTSNINFTIENSGTTNLNLTGSTMVQISGPDASQFSVLQIPTSPVEPYGSTIFQIGFTPTSIGTKTATVSITNDDADKTPYTFTVTGTGTAMEVLAPDTWTQGNLATSGSTKMYSINAIIGKVYSISWDDSYEGSGTYTCYIKVSGYHQDLTTKYFSNINSGHGIITAQDNIVYISVAGYFPNSTGTYALKVTEIIPEPPVINVKQGSTIIANGTGSYNYGNVSHNSTSIIIFRIENGGTTNLNLTGSPRVQISGSGASQFSVLSQPTSPVIPYGKEYFCISFTPTSTGVKTATVSITNDDVDKTPYTFTITGTGTAMEVLAPDTWTQGNLETSCGSTKMYSFNVIAGKVYAISWDDFCEGTGTYTCDIKVSGYHQDLTTTYFSDIDPGYINPRIIMAQENIVYISVAAYSCSYHTTGTYALKVKEIITPPPVINVKQGDTIIVNGTGRYNYGNVSCNSISNSNFTIENNRTTNLNLTGSTMVQISGPDASQFSVTTNPTSPVMPYGSTTFGIDFTPTSIGVKTAIVSITNDDTDRNPYIFTITGTGTAMEVLAPDTWTQGNLKTSGSVKMYSFDAITGKVYSISWDDSYEGSGIYTCDIMVSGYHQDLTTTYFSNIDSGYINPRIITAQDNIVYISVADYSWPPIGTYALKVTEIIPEPPVINVKQGSTIIVNGMGSYNYGNVSSNSTSNINFTIENRGTTNLNLTGNPKVQISGADASQFSVTINPTSPVIPYGSKTFRIGFTPTSVGVKTATVSIANDDADRNPYTFTITGTGTAMEVLALDTWTQGNLTTSGSTKMYSFNVISGKVYSISWDDSYEGSGTYNCNINVSGYHQNLTTKYFSNIDSGYINPRIITAQDNIVYISVACSSPSTGTYALRVTEIIQEPPVINVKQGATVIANGTGSYNYGDVSCNSSSYIIFEIENRGTTDLNLTGNPEVQISGADASQFSVITVPASPVIPYGSTIFRIGFTPTSIGVKTATVSITNDDTDRNPYTFTITGTGTAMEVLTLGIWTQGNLTTCGTKMYSFSARQGKTYTVSWDDSGQGSGVYNCDIVVIGYRQDLERVYFCAIDSGYITPQTITALEKVVYIKVAECCSIGSYALKVTELP